VNYEFPPRYGEKVTYKTVPQNRKKSQFLVKKTGAGFSPHIIYLLSIYSYYVPRIHKTWQRIDLSRAYSFKFFLTQKIPIFYVINMHIGYIFKVNMGINL